MKYLVTGGAGFIGSHIVSALIERGKEVIVLDNFSTGLKANIPKGASVIIGHAGDHSILDEILPNCAAIFHLAAVSSVQASIDNPLKVHDENLTTTLALLEAARQHGVKRFVFSSSAAVYGDTQGIPAKETMKPCPLSYYAVQKMASEMYCEIYYRLHRIETVCLRYFNVFGPRQSSNSIYSGVIAQFIAAARLKKQIVIFGDGLQTRDFCPVTNVVAANLAAAFEPANKVAGKVFNIGSGNAISILKVVESIREIFPDMPVANFCPARLGEVQHSCADISQAREKLGYEPTGTFKQTLEALALGIEI
jgi:nucleoside-diphosphate-sugar epimerase